MIVFSVFTRNLQIQFHVEAGNLSHVFYRYKEAREHFNTAKKLADISIQLTGKSNVILLCQLLE